MSDQDVKSLAIAVIWFITGGIIGFLICKSKNVIEENKNKMIVTCTLLGGFGNNLFIMIATIAYSLRHKIDYCIPTIIENPHYENQKVFFSPQINYRNLNLNEEHGKISVHAEQGFNYEEIPKYNCDILLLRGYFQSYKYWFDFLPQLKAKLGFDCKVKRPHTCAIHVRRGDYLNLPTIHPVITPEYIREAIDVINNGAYIGFNLTFRFYSDDIPYCRRIASEIMANKKHTYEFANGNEEEDFIDMVGCRLFIISNSSFSLMAALLSESPNKVVVAPRKWFGSAMRHNTDDLMPDNFILI